MLYRILLIYKIYKKTIIIIDINFKALSSHIQSAFKAFLRYFINISIIKDIILQLFFAVYTM